MPSNQRHLEQVMTSHSKTEQDIERAEREVAQYDQKTPYDHGHVSNEMRAWARFMGQDPDEIKKQNRQKALIL